MFIIHTNSQTDERQILTGLFAQYRRPCFYGGIDIDMCKTYVTDLITLYDLTWEKSGATHAEDFDIITSELLSDIRYEINQTCKKANIEFEWFKRTLYNKGCIDKWEALSASHLLF